MKQYNAARTYQFRVQLTRDDHRRLAGHCRLYSGAVQERRDGRSPSPASAVSSSWCARTIRCGLATPQSGSGHPQACGDLVLQAFFRRVKAGVSGGGKVGHVGGLIVGFQRTSTTQWHVLPPPLTRHTPAIRENAPSIPSEHL